jgi:DNA protecting protein DprA
VNELALAVFASEIGAHLLEPPHERRWSSHLRAFDAAAYERQLTARGYRFIARSARGFPTLLRAIHDPPAGLFLRGDAELELLSRPAVAVVGARACSGYGSSVARSLGRELARAGLVVVSGMARGIDADAHRGALEAGGATVAVFGCGIDRDYPAAHAELARRIAANGLLVSEYAPGVDPAPWRFPARNRIVAGLCAATVVVEARERSGALITADLALEEGRRVAADGGCGRARELPPRARGAAARDLRTARPAAGDRRRARPPHPAARLRRRPRARRARAFRCRGRPRRHLSRAVIAARKPLFFDSVSGEAARVAERLEQLRLLRLVLGVGRIALQ